MDGWNLKITGGMSAHFKQESGPSRPAILWSIAASNGKVEKKLLVRDYIDDPGGHTQEQSAQATIAYIGSLIQGGWSPMNYTGLPEELIVSPRG